MTIQDGLQKPQLITHLQQPLNYTAFDCHWIPCSAKCVVLGQHARGTGALQVYEMQDGQFKAIVDVEKSTPFKCATFGSSSLQQRHLATGDFQGRLSSWDLENISSPVYSVQAHDAIVNCIDGAGGVGIRCGAPELVTGSRDGRVRVWDTRQKDSPVADIGPAEGEPVRDCWSVSFGNSYNDQERCVLAGYDNGDVKLFDLRTMSMRWSHNFPNGICSVEFDRKDIPMNKCMAVGLESMANVVDLRTYHPKKGYAVHSERLVTDSTTLWTVRHLPQNREIFMTSGGNGGLNLYKYHYPTRRVEKDTDGLEYGVCGSLELLNYAVVAEQPVAAFAWNADKLGLCVFIGFDQMLRVGIVTKLNLY